MRRKHIASLHVLTGISPRIPIPMRTAQWYVARCLV